MPTGTEFDLSTEIGKLRFREAQLQRTIRRLRSASEQRHLLPYEVQLSFDTSDELVKVQSRIEQIEAPSGS